MKNEDKEKKENNNKERKLRENEDEEQEEEDTEEEDTEEEEEEDCDFNTPARIALAQQWDGTREPFQYLQLPPCLYICGIVPLSTSFTTVQIALVQKYLSSILMRWDPSRFRVDDIDISEQ